MKIDNLSKKQFEELIYDYYNSTMSIKKILEKYNLTKISSAKLCEYFPNVQSGNNCVYCKSMMVYAQKSKTAYKQNFKYSDEVCPGCNHKIVHSAFGMKACSCNNCVQRQQEMEKEAIKFDELKYLSLSEKCYLLALLMYLYDESNHSFKSVTLVDGIKFAPMQQYGFSIFNSLLNYSLIKFKTTQKTIENFILKENGNYSYAPYVSEYKLNLLDLELFTFSEIVKNCEYVHAYSLYGKKNEAVELWKEIGFQELLEYTHNVFEKFNFDTNYIGDAIIEKLQLILEDFSISQGYAIIYSSIKAAAAYKQTGIPSKHAVNSVNTYIANNISKRKSNEWENKGYKRDYELPQTAISMVFFNNILKIGDRGFDEVPKIDSIPNKFIDELERIDSTSSCSENNNQIANEVLELFSQLTKEQYSFGELMDQINKEFILENKPLRQVDDLEILKKLKGLKGPDITISEIEEIEFY